jgi:hypothetical protein
MKTGYFRRRWPLAVYATSLSAFDVVEGSAIWRKSEVASDGEVQRWLEIRLIGWTWEVGYGTDAEVGDGLA